MKFHTFISILVLLAFTACKKDKIKPQPDERYPYTYYKLTPAEWDSRYAELQSLNEDDSLTIDEYGFLEGKFNINGEVSEDYVLSKIDSIIKTFGEFMGIKDYSSFDLSGALYVYDFCLQYEHKDIDEYFNLRDSVLKYEPEGFPTTYNFYLYQEGIGYNHRENPIIEIELNEIERTIAVKGHWYPDIFKPSEAIYTVDEALNIYNKSSDYEYKGDENNELFNDPIEKIFIPIGVNETIELHECWAIILQHGIHCSYYVYVDTQTGELLKEGMHCYNDIMPFPCEYYFLMR